MVAQAISNGDTFASTNHLYADTSYHPSSQVTEVPVQAGCFQAAGSDDGAEVALDTQTLLAASPQLRQRVYQVDNCGDAQHDAIAQILSDVQAGMPIVALSTSWGSCEKMNYGSTKADVDDVNALLAAGVTMFAASGDDGADDCNIHPGADAVDSPAAIPGVVAVGGTTGTTAATETIWNDGAGYATGGGFSCGFFARPAYQAKVAKPASYPHNGFTCPSGSSERMVPDIAANGGNGIAAIVHRRLDDRSRAGLRDELRSAPRGRRLRRDAAPPGRHDDGARRHSRVPLCGPGLLRRPRRHQRRVRRERGVRPGQRPRDAQLADGAELRARRRGRVGVQRRGRPDPQRPRR